jgi:hypothetical protein
MEMDDGSDSSSDELEMSQSEVIKRGQSSAHDINKRFEFPSAKKNDILDFKK